MFVGGGCSLLIFLIIVCGVELPPLSPLPFGPSPDIQMERNVANGDYAPPDPTLLAEQREQRMKEIKMEAVLKEIIVYFFFVLIIFFISYQQRDPASYNFGSNIGNIFLDGHDSVSV